MEVKFQGSNQKIVSNLNEFFSELKYKVLDSNKNTKN